MVSYIKNSAEFEKLLKDAGDKAVVIDFTATWCPPCKRIGPIFDAMQNDFSQVLFYKVDVD